MKPFPPCLALSGSFGVTSFVEIEVISVSLDEVTATVVIVDDKGRAVVIATEAIKSEIFEHKDINVTNGCTLGKKIVLLDHSILARMFTMRAPTN